MSIECPAVPADTSLEVWRMQIEGIRRRSIEERFAIFEKRQEWQHAAEIDFLRRRFPDADGTTLTIERIRLRHGNELAAEAASLILGDVNTQAAATAQ